MPKETCSILYQVTSALTTTIEYVLKNHSDRKYIEANNRKFGNIIWYIPFVNSM